MCDSCGESMVRVGEGEEEKDDPIRCQKCWCMIKLSLEDRIKELENKNEGEELSFRECCDCDNLRARVAEMEAVVERKGGEEGAMKSRMENQNLKLESVSTTNRATAGAVAAPKNQKRPRS